MASKVKIHKTIRLRNKKLYLTYPKCYMKKELVMDHIKEMFGESWLSWAVVCEEDHADGTPHLHCIIVLNKVYSTRKVHALDILAGKHGNYQNCRNAADVLDYVIKEGNYVEYKVNAMEFIAAAKAKKSTKSTIIANRIIVDKAPVDDIILEYPGYALMHLKKIVEFDKFVSVMQEGDDLMEWGGVSESDYWPAAAQMIARWLNKNVCKPREFKQSQLYIWGDTNMGKTHLINELEKYLRIYYLPTENFYDDYRDGQYDLIVADEFKGQCRLTFLNKLLEGSTMPIPKKGYQALKRDNLPMIILSNYDIDGCYRNLDYVAHEALRGRLEVVNLQAQLDLKYYNAKHWKAYKKRILKSGETLDSMEETELERVMTQHRKIKCYTNDHTGVEDYSTANTMELYRLYIDSMKGMTCPYKEAPGCKLHSEIDKLFDSSAPDAGTATQPYSAHDSSSIDLRRADNVINIRCKIHTDMDHCICTPPSVIDVDAINSQSFGMWDDNGHDAATSSSDSHSLFTKSPGFKDF